MKLKFLFSLITLVSVLPVVAQYQWIDANGRKVFSDQPPPPSVPSKKVLQQPKNTPTPTNLESAKPADAATPADAKTDGKADTENSKATPAAKKDANLGKDKELEAKKKAAEDAETAKETAKKKAEADKQAAARADNCERAKRAKMTLDSGTRTTITNRKGEREFMDDAARMVESKRIEGIIATDCK